MPGPGQANMLRLLTLCNSAVHALSHSLSLSLFSLHLQLEHVRSHCCCCSFSCHSLRLRFAATRRDVHVSLLPAYKFQRSHTHRQKKIHLRCSMDLLLEIQLCLYFYPLSFYTRSQCCFGAVLNTDGSLQLFMQTSTVFTL